jgi:hypothetical protein
VKRSTKIIIMGGITVFAALAAWLAGLTGPSGSERTVLRGIVVETGTKGNSFIIFCPGNGRQTILPDKECKILRKKQVGLDNVPVGRLTEIKGMVENNPTAIWARSMTVYPAGERREEELTGYRAAGTLAKRGNTLVLTAKGKEIAVRSSQATSIIVQDAPDPSGPALDSLVEVIGRPGWGSVKASEIIIRRTGPDVQDTPGLPRVLLLGGPLGGRGLGPVRKTLKGIANVHQSGAGWENTDTVLENLDELLGPYQWDRTRWTVIYFNFGIGDLRLVNGKNRIPLEKYTRNLQAILARLESTHAKLIWATIPPPRQDRPRPDIRVEDISQYNAASIKIMGQNKIEINNLAALVPPKLQGQSAPAARNTILVEEITAAIKNILGK